MRVALVAESFLPRVNGVSNSVVRVSRHLRAAGHEILIVAPDSYTAEQFEDSPVARVNSIVVPGIHDTDVAFSSTESLTRHLRAFRPDVVHLASPFMLGRVAARAARQLQIPVVAIFQTDVAGFARHYGLSLVSTLADVVIRHVHSKADLTLVPSSGSAAYLAGLGVRNVKLWGRGVDAEMFNPRWRDPNLYSRDGRTVVGYVGRVAPEKNIEILRHVSRDPSIRLVVIGDGPSRSELERLLPEAHFAGMLGGTDLSRHVASLDVLVATGERETFCQVVQEGMAAGLPVVAPAVGGPLDLIDHNRNGLLYAPGNGRHMRASVKRLAADPALRRVLGTAARSKVESRTWQAIGDELVAHYRSVLQPASAVAS